MQGSLIAQVLDAPKEGEGTSLNSPYIPHSALRLSVFLHYPGDAENMVSTVLYSFDMFTCCLKRDLQVT